MIDNGEDPYIVAVIRAMRDSIPPKGRMKWKVKQYVDAVETLRSFSKDLLSGKISKEKFKAGLEDNASLKERIEGTAALYQAVGHEHPLKGIRLKKGSYSFFKGVEYKPSKIIWSVEKEAIEDFGEVGNVCPEAGPHGIKKLTNPPSRVS